LLFVYIFAFKNGSDGWHGWLVRGGLQQLANRSLNPLHSHACLVVKFGFGAGELVVGNAEVNDLGGLLALG